MIKSIITIDKLSPKTINHFINLERAKMLILKNAKKRSHPKAASNTITIFKDRVRFLLGGQTVMIKQHRLLT